jgi:hypothetical protein
MDDVKALQKDVVSRLRELVHSHDKYLSSFKLGGCDRCVFFTACYDNNRTADGYIDLARLRGKLTICTLLDSKDIDYYRFEGTSDDLSVKVWLRFDAKKLLQEYKTLGLMQVTHS